MDFLGYFFSTIMLNFALKLSLVMLLDTDNLPFFYFCCLKFFVFSFLVYACCSLISCPPGTT